MVNKERALLTILFLAMLAMIMALMYLLMSAQNTESKVVYVKDEPKALPEGGLPEPVSYDITAKIPKGHRAVAIPVDPISGVEGWVAPGVRVDVVWTTIVDGQPMAVTIVENAHVLSAGRRTDKNSAPLGAVNGVSVQAEHVTLLATIADSQKIQLAKKSPGSLSLSLRGDGDLELQGVETTETGQLLGISATENPTEEVELGGKSYILNNGQLINKEVMLKLRAQDIALKQEQANVVNQQINKTK